MKRTQQIQLLLMAIFLAITLFSCTNTSEPTTPKRSILVINSYNKHGVDGDYFIKKMTDDFVKQGINPDIHIIYINTLHYLNDYWRDNVYNVQYRDSVIKWKPEIVLLNDDPAFLFAVYDHGDDSLFTNVPSVFAGVNDVLHDSIDNFPLMTGFEDKIDFDKNIEFAADITKSQALTIELDEGRFQDKMRAELIKTIDNNVHFIDNSDFHIKQFDADYLQKIYPRKIIINFITCCHPEQNCEPGAPASDGKKNISNMLFSIDNIINLQVKYDIFSNSLIQNASYPQFTCIREQFNENTPMFLGGYFTTLEEQINAQVNYAVDILNGTSPERLPIVQHRTTYNLDYRAMQKMKAPLRYDDYKDKCDIYNAPLSVTDPERQFAIYTMIAIMIIAVIAMIVAFVWKFRKKTNESLQEELEYEQKMQELLYADARNTLWRIKDDMCYISSAFASSYHLPTCFPVSKLRDMTHPDTIPALEKFLDFRNQRGKKIYRMKLTASEGRNWIWTELSYTATDETARTGEIYGILIDINKYKAIEDELLHAQSIANEVSLKENFLANISHDLRTPLNAITGFSSLLTNENMTFAEGEREEYCTIIHQNTEMILKMIDGVMMKAQLLTGDIELILKPYSVYDLVKEVYKTNKIIAPSHIDFRMDNEERGVKINIDLTRTIQVMNNFLSNAFKFTFEGSITLGWKSVRNDMVEIYVQDTGIGISEDKLNTIFNRYAKENETDQGTGLGLDISKTIIEQESGTIGVESELGKGSKFFFRLKRYMQCILMLLTFGVSMCTLSSCDGMFMKRKMMKNVIVLHAFNEEFKNYEEFDDAIVNTFFDNNINANIQNIYLGLDNHYQFNEKNVTSVTNKLRDCGWKTDAILIEGDRAFNFYHNELQKYLADYNENIPVIVGALHHPDWEEMRNSKHLVALYDPIDYTSNINLASELGGLNIVCIELDFFPYDSLLRAELRDAINRPPFLDNTDYHLMDASNPQNTEQVWRDSLIVTTYSVESPETNVSSSPNDTLPYTNTRNMYMYAFSFPQLSIKNDLYSNAIIDKTSKPQFTAVKAGFADGSGRFLAGYFASYTTVGSDIANAASKIFYGTDSRTLNGKKHEKRYYMNYNAMERMGLNYYDYNKRFTIINAPLKYTNPYWYYGRYALIALLILGLIAGSIHFVIWNRNRLERKLVEELRQTEDFRNLAVNGADSHTIKSPEELRRIIASIHEDYQSDIIQIQNDMFEDGTHDHVIYSDFDEKGHYRWWQLRFVSLNQENDQRINGILINIDELKKYEQDLQTALQLAEEAKSKEDFLMTINHEIRTPLNAVVGFSDVLCSLPESMITPEEKLSYAKYINENNLKLTNMIEDILMFSRIESGRIQYICSEFVLGELMDEISKEWEKRMPDNLRLITANFRNNIIVNSDRTRIQYILNQLFSNAVKFTEEGAIVFSVIYHFNTDEAEIILSDTGCGIPREKQSAIFNLFWKDNEFIPGLGLGLNVAHRIADALGVKISVESRPGFGSRFSVFIKAKIQKK